MYHTRPRTLFIPNGSFLHIANLTIVDSPSWNMGIRAHNVLIEHINVSSGAPGCGAAWSPACSETPHRPNS